VMMARHSLRWMTWLLLLLLLLLLLWGTLCLSLVPFVAARVANLGRSVCRRLGSRSA
jgi:hypothetical protein